MQVSDAGIELIKSFEGFRANAYPDPKSGGDPWTVGYGTTKFPSGRPVKKGDCVTSAQAEMYLREDVKKFANSVDALVTVPLKQCQYDAIVSFVYNLGATNFRKSTLLKKLNAKDYKGAADEFLRWVSPGSSVEAGLRRRRTAERAMFLS